MRKWFAEVLSLPEDLTEALPRIELIGNRRVQIDNYLSVDNFDSRRLLLKVKQGQISITGENLRIKAIYPEGLVIEGLILAVQLKERDSSHGAQSAGQSRGPV
jgi:sporulation protein YqfC